jgi:DNA-3-methyladenine glycosylase II
MNQAVEYLKRRDARLARVIELAGPYKLKTSPVAFSTLAHAIVDQQLSLKAAATIWSRLEAALAPDPVGATALLRLSEDDLRGLGISRQKGGYLRSLAEKSLDGTIDFERLPEMADADVIAHLTEAKGVGIWTAHMFLIFALGRPDVLPTGDLGVQNAVKRVYRLRAAPTARKIEQLGKKWRPWASVASWYLWRSLEFDPQVWKSPTVPVENSTSLSTR